MSAEALNMNTMAGGPDTMDDPIGGSAEKAKTYREIGAERRTKINQSIAQKKAWLKGWFEKAKTVAGATKDAAIDYTLATPEMAYDAGAATLKAGATAAAAGVGATVFGAQFVGRGAQLAGAYAQHQAVEGFNAANKKVDAAVEAIDNKVTEVRLKGEAAVEQGKAWAGEKAAAGKAWVTNQAETAQALAQIGTHLAKGAALSAKGQIEDSISTAKENIKNGYTSTLERGRSAIASAEQKASAFVQKFRSWKNTKRLEMVQYQEDALKKLLVGTLKQKNELLTQSFVNPQA